MLERAMLQHRPVDMPLNYKPDKEKSHEKICPSHRSRRDRYPDSHGLGKGSLMKVRTKAKCVTVVVAGLMVAGCYTVSNSLVNKAHELPKLDDNYLPDYSGDGVPTAYEIEMCQNVMTSMYATPETPLEVIYDPETNHWTCER